MRKTDSFTREPRIAYFSMEMALDPAIPTYSGGLGVLAGDTMRSAVNLHLPMVGVTLVSRNGYFRQEIGPGGKQIEHPDPWQPEQHAHRVGAGVAVPIEGREVWVSAWIYVLKGAGGAELPILFLDTDLPINTEEDRRITHYLYGGDSAYRLKQEIVLGVGAVRILRALGCGSVAKNVPRLSRPVHYQRRARHDLDGRAFRGTVACRSWVSRAEWPSTSVRSCYSMT